MARSPVSRLRVSLSNYFRAFASIPRLLDALEKEADCLEKRASADASVLEVSYTVTYPEFLRFFRDAPKKLTQHHLLIAAGFTYGWMPRTLRISPAYLAPATGALNTARSRRTLGSAGIATLANFLNGSISGASKLLHFANPDLHPIWDSRVCRFLGAKEKVVSMDDKVALYAAYVAVCHDVAESHRGKKLVARIRRRGGKDITRIRAIEALMYQGGVRK